jgi:predicted GIY-YIG superfamily endonuclease
LSRLTKSRGKIELVYVKNFETRAGAAKKEKLRAGEERVKFSK